MSSLTDRAEYKEYQQYIESICVHVGNIDAPYGLIGNAAPMMDLPGGAVQLKMPFNAEILEKTGRVLTENQEV